MTGSFYLQSMSKYFLAIFACLGLTSATAQMWNGQDTLYGNEWINYDQDYYRIEVSEDGIYRIPQSVLLAAGFPAATQPSQGFKLYAYGEEVPLYATTSGNMSANDYLEFYGEKHRMQMDQYLFEKQEDVLNPTYSVITDQSTYFLTYESNASGKRYLEVQNDLSNLGAAESFYMHHELISFTDEAVQYTAGQGVKYSHFDEGEGFASQYAKERTISIPASNVVPAGDATLNINFVSSTSVHDLNLSFNDITLLQTQFGNYKLTSESFPITSTTLTASNTLVLEGQADNNDRHAVAFAELVYPRAFDFQDLGIYEFGLTSGDRQYLEITNFDEADGTPVLYDPTNQIRIVATYQTVGDQVRLAIPEGESNRKLILSNDKTSVKLVEGMTKYTPLDFMNQSGDYIIISHPFLMGSPNYVEQYAQYRASAAGGGYNVQVINIEDIYDQFGYGTPRHPQCLRNFSHWVVKNYTDPKYLFIIGKGIDYTLVRSESQISNPMNSAFYVPTWGSPGSDNLLFSDDISSMPVIPAGRLAVAEPGQLKTYLDKVQLQEATFSNSQTIDDRYWMKRVMHLSGGGTQGTEQAQIANALANMELTLENNSFGADVTTFYKTSSDPVQISESDAIFDLINDGVAIISFFGHSSVGTFDFSIDNPDNYENYGKYPLIISMGCYSGNIHTNGEGISERFVFYEEKGALAFMASVGQAYVPNLSNFGNKFYGHMGTDFYGAGIGDIMRQVIDDLNGNMSFSNRTLMQQMALNGDPALKIYNVHEGTDYVVDASSVAFTPSVLNAQLDSFDIQFDLVNLGQGQTDSFDIMIEQILPTGEKYSLVNTRVFSPKSKSKINYTLPNFGNAAAGLNRFLIKVDVANEVDELPAPIAEMNNSLIGSDNQEGVPVFIFDNSLEPIFPENFAIVNDDAPIRLVSSTRNAFLPAQKFILEIDTTELFNSPLKIREERTQLGGVLNWEPSVAWENEKVYYWRVSPDSTSLETPYIWKTRSFVYLADSEPGWNQSHFFQYNKNNFEGMEINPGENLEYLANGFIITIRNTVFDPNDAPYYHYNLASTSSVKPWDFLNSGIAIVVGDSITGGAWPNPPGGLYGTVNNPTVKTRVFAFPTSTPEERALVIDFLDNVIPSDSYVFAFTILRDQNQDFHPENWADDEATLGKSIFTIFEDQGAQLARDLSTGSRAYNFIYKKDAGPMAENIAENFNDAIVSEVFVPVLSTSGEMISEKIGPANQWNMLTWSFEQQDSPTDSSYLQLFGLTTTGQVDTIVAQLSGSSYDLSAIDVAQYPYLQLGLASEDPQERTATDLTNWRITYEGKPDLALNPAVAFSVSSDTLQEGDTFTFETAITNTSNYTIAKSEAVANFVFNGSSTTETSEVQSLAPGESTQVAFELSTIGHGGKNSFLIEVNPTDNPNEQHRFNNLGALNYFVTSDKTNPLLEVVFDGIHIMNGDIVSARPEVNIRLKDENPFLILQDTTLLKLILKDPEQNTKAIYFSNPNIVFEPAGGDRNEAFIEWRPTFDVDGDYQLIVQGEDVTGNQSGALDYKINFKIVNKKMISNVLNYPNPFSTATRFVYTLTGDQTPDFFKIQIFNASGRIVKEITEQEIGPLKVGTHKTDYVWDGSDDFGDRLANGVYFYRVVTKNVDGSNYEAYINNSVDQFFQEGFGKLVIMR